MYLYPNYYRAIKNIYSITINTSARILTLLKNGVPYRNYKVAVGKTSTPTPKGYFKIMNKAVNPKGTFGARWLGLSKPGYGIHGTNNPSSIGKAVSNGCIRLYNQNVIELFNIVPINTPVKII